MEVEEKCNVAFLGLGVMGFPMAGHLARAGYRVTVYNRTSSKAQKWCETYDGKSALTPREADVIKLYFGLGNHHPMTLEEIGETFDLTRERVRQIKEKAIRRLKHTSRSKILKTYLG